ncbi:MAG: EAL domain-containing protein [Xanthomonadaceae bacterium]|nr:EAL domain-containing protein [Xanthomonadaceae bacterium]
MTRRLIRGSVLVVVLNREDRRALFETLDGYEFDAIYTAKDFAQAHAFLAQAPRLDAVLLEFQGEAVEAVAFCKALRGSGSAAPVVGVATAADLATRWRIEDEPDVVADWLRSPVLGQEALHRLQRVLAAGKPAFDPRRTGERPLVLGGGDPAVHDAADELGIAFEQHPDELVLSDLDSGRIVDANPVFCRRSGIAREQAVGRSIDGIDLTHDPAARHSLRQALRRTGAVRFRCDKPDASGRPYLVDVAAQMVDTPRGRFVLSTLRELPGERALHDALQAAAALGRPSGSPGEGVVEALVAWLDADAIWVVERADATSDVESVLHQHGEANLPEGFFPDVFRRLRGGEPLVHAENAALSLGRDRPAGLAGFEGFAAAPIIDQRLAQTGAVVACRRRPFVAQGLREVMEVAAARLGLEMELEHTRALGRAQGLQDSLTGMPNRLLFNDRLDTTIKEAHRTGEMFAVLFVDLDRFKNINDSLGHGVGDEVLMVVARRLRASVRASDTVARYAGDEFTLILRHIVQRDDVLRIAEKICRVLESPLPLDDGRELHITASIGISLYPDDAASADKMLQHADVAMYSAKGMGRNTFQTYVAVPEESHQQRLALEAKLRQAERNNELRVYYQPQIAADSEDVVGMEALIRWEHPELGMISPGFFIPLAEETGLIVSIGEWVLRQACADTRRWQDRFGMPLRISVNLSALQLRQPNLAEVVRRAVTDTGLDPKTLELEVTESISVKSIPNLMETLQSLRELGVSIAIDDFGTGQSSLDYIRRFPADRIKIDQVFVRNIGVDPDDEAIVRATIHMAHNLNLSVVAEGVEYEEHFAFLREHGCEELQGYLFCRPLAPASFENLLAERERLLAAGAAAGGQ